MESSRYLDCLVATVTVTPPSEGNSLATYYQDRVPPVVSVINSPVR
jgi:hypothetical protein